MHVCSSGNIDMRVKRSSAVKDATPALTLRERGNCGLWIGWSLIRLFHLRKFEVKPDFILDQQVVREEGGSEERKYSNHFFHIEEIAENCWSLVGMENGHQWALWLWCIEG